MLLPGHCLCLAGVDGTVKIWMLTEHAAKDMQFSLFRLLKFSEKSVSECYKSSDDFKCAGFFHLKSFFARLAVTV